MKGKYRCFHRVPRVIDQVSHHIVLSQELRSDQTADAFTRCSLGSFEGHSGTEASFHNTKGGSANLCLKDLLADIEMLLNLLIIGTSYQKCTECFFSLLHDPLATTLFCLFTSPRTLPDVVHNVSPSLRWTVQSSSKGFKPCIWPISQPC